MKSSQSKDRQKEGGLRGGMSIKRFSLGLYTSAEGMTQSGCLEHGVLRPCVSDAAAPLPFIPM